jgi:radical SAM protein with 4Fe4S-binding SPASM domain
MTLTPADPRALETWPAELASLPFGSPEFKAANEKLALEDELALRPFARAMPTWINLTSTTVCNLKCFMCNQFLDPNSPKVIMEDEVYDKVVRELYPYAKTMQLSAFGEPLMTPKMEQKLDDLERYGMKLEMVSNATLMMKESKFREKLVKQLELITFSMDGATRETYNSIRTGAEFNEVVDNITRFTDLRWAMPKEKRPQLNFNFILMKRTLQEAPKFVEMTAKWGADLVVFNHLVSFHESLKGESLQYCREETNYWQDRTREVAKALGVNIKIPPNFTTVEEPAVAAAPAPAVVASGTAAAATATAAPQQPKGRPCTMPEYRCWFLWRRVYIAPYGDVIPCCVAGMPNFGNLLKEPFWDVWNNSTYQTHRKHVYTEKPYGKCRRCYLIYPNAELAGEEGFEY